MSKPGFIMPYVPLVVLSYFFAAPPIAGVLFFTILSFGELSIRDWLGALPPVMGFSYIVGALPAIAAAIVAGLAQRSATWWGRIGPPMVIGALAAMLMVWAVLLRGAGWDTRLMVVAGVAAACAAALIGGLLEVARGTIFRED